MDGRHEFQVADYAVFGATVVVSLGIGVFHACTGDKQTTTSQYLVGGNKMGLLPVAISLMVSFESSLNLLGLPSEAYVYGVQYVWAAAGYLLSQLMFTNTVVPMLRQLQLTTSFEYLQMRFNSTYVRLLGTVYGMCNHLLYMGFILYGPAVALEAVSGMPVWISVVVISTASVTYTAIGGFKAVVWTDVFQAVIMTAGLMAVLIKGTMEVGGPSRVWEVAEAGGRLNFFNFDVDLRIRHTFWNLLICYSFRGVGFVYSQYSVQRISSTASVKDAKIAMYTLAVGYPIVILILLYEGLVAFAYYSDLRCDPLASKTIRSPNEIVPCVVMDLFNNLPGLPGIFIAALFSASLSSLSSSLNGLSAIALVDIVRPIVGDVSEAKATFISKLSVVVFGALSCGIAFLAAEIGGTIMAVFISLSNAFSGPGFGMFILGTFCPRANAKGALIGSLLSFVFMAWITFSMNFSSSVKRTPFLPSAPVDSCYLATNGTSMYQTATAGPVPTPPSAEPQGVEYIYNISYNWTVVIGTLSTVALGMVFSAIDGFNMPGDVTPLCLVSVTDTFLFFFPASLRKRISSIGVQFMDEKYKDVYPNLSNMGRRISTVPFMDEIYNNSYHKDVEADMDTEMSNISSDTSYVTTDKSQMSLDTCVHADQNSKCNVDILNDSISMPSKI